MPKYLFEVNYTLEGVRGLESQGGSAREEAAQAAAKSVGGSLDSFYYAFGKADLFTIGDMPDNAAAAAFSLAVTAAGGVTVRTIVLLTPQEIDKAAKKKVKYTPPGG
jgi:uncharacterized protein with GYD domain